MSENRKNVTKAKERTKSLSSTLDDLELQTEEINKIYRDFKDEVIGENDKKVDGNLSILGDIKNSQGQITQYYHELLQSSDEEKSIKDKIADSKKSIEDIKANLENIEQSVQDSKTNISTLEEKCEAEKGEIKEILNESNISIEEIRKLHDNIRSFNEKIETREEQIKKQDETIQTLQDNLDTLNKESQKLFEEWTDQSLHNAFKKEAIEKKDEHKKYFRYIHWYLGSGVLLLLGMQIGSHFWWKFSNFEMWFTRFTIFSPIGYLSWLCASKSDIFLKFSEEYQHKASISEALSGYRKLWNLEHDSSEYRAFFDKTINDIIANPSDKIKISNKDVLSKVPDAVVSIAKEDNSIIEEDIINK